jgi:spoIIIJ-associated protein
MWSWRGWRRSDVFSAPGEEAAFRVVPDGSFPCLHTKELTRLLLERMELQVEGRITDEGMIDLVGEDAGIVIGRYGETLKPWNT